MWEGIFIFFRYNNNMPKDSISIIISIILGFSLAMLFRKVCQNRNCIILTGSKIEDMKNNIEQINGKCH